MRALRILSVVAALTGGLALPSSEVVADSASGSSILQRRTNGMISMGYDHACAVNLAGEVSCWGQAYNGQLGIGDTSASLSTAPAAAVELPGVGRARTVSVGERSACAVLIDGAVTCWGSNDYDELGTGDSISWTSPSPVLTLPSPGKAREVAVGGGFACALLIDGKISCWGTGANGELGNGAGTDSPTPSATITLPSPGTAIAIDAAEQSVCAVLTGGAVTCWGRDRSDILGNGAAGNQLAPPTPITLPSPGTATAISMGEEHACVVLTGGAVSCWGSDGYGQLGNGAGGTDWETPSPVITLPSPGTATAIAAGGEVTCAILTGGAVSCWGNGYNLGLGNGIADEVDAPGAPVALPAPSAASAITVGNYASCALLTNGRISCWGTDRWGTVGNSTENGNQAEPSAATPVGGTAVQVSANGEASCALRANGNVYCWGSDWDDQIASGVLLGEFDVPRTDPIVFPAPNSVAQVVLGDRNACARLTNGSVTCWGREFEGELGNGALGSQAVPPAPVALPAPSTAIDLSTRRNHTCAVLTGGAVTCWGRNIEGQLGIGSFVDQLVPPAPITLPSPGTASAVGVGDDFTCALLTDGKVTCWGSASGGQLGNGTSSPNISSPPAKITLPAPGTATSISVGSGHACAVLTSGSVACWGSNSYGQVGVGDTTQRTSPVAVSLPAPGTASAVSAGNATTCALLTSGEVSCWGDSTVGQTGTGVFGEVLVPSDPIDLPSPGTAADVSVADDHACVALTGLGRVSCWGEDDRGEVGDGAIDDGVQPLPSDGYLVQGRQVAPPDLLPVAPARLLETRGGSNVTIDGLFQGVGKLSPGGTLALTVAGRGGVASDALAVGLNFTAVNPTGNGYLTVYPCGTTQPTASNLNFRAGKTIANLVVAEPGTNGQVCVFSSAETDLLVDVSSVVLPGSTYVPVDPARLLETRTGPGNDTIDGLFEGQGQRGAGTTLQLDVADRGGVPADALAVVVNIAAVSPAANGFVTVYPCGVTRPTASNLNAQTGVTVSTAAVVEIGTAGRICIYTSMATHMLVDVNTVVPASTRYEPVTPARLLETRSGMGNVTIDGLFQGGGVGTAGSEIELTVWNRGGIGSAAKTVSLTIVAISPATGGFITVYPCGTPRPTASNLNLVAGRTIANAVFAEVGDNGKVCIYRSAAVHLAVDVQGRML